MLQLRRHPHSARGFTLVEIMIALAISTMLLIFAARALTQEINDAAATATGRHMMTVRGAVLEMLTTHYAAFHGVDISAAPPGMYPPFPTPLEVSLDHMATYGDTRINVGQLKLAGLLPSGFPEFPPLGHGQTISLTRTGACPGNDCAIEAYVYTCWAISSDRQPFWDDDCQESPDVDPDLLAQVMMATEGYGAHNLMDSTRARGPLLNVPMSDFWGGAGAPPPGIVAVVASLDSTHFNQFVRMGDDRHVFLADALTTKGVITTETGIILDTAVVNGAACDQPGMYATSVRGVLASCIGSRWFEQIHQVVTWSSANLANGSIIARPSCPSGTVPFRHIAMQRTDVTISGGNLNLMGNVTGSVSGTGNVNSTGSVSVNGTVNGTVSNGPGSTVRVDQGVSTTGTGPWTVRMTPTGANARAVAVAGCEYT